jgi:tRNA1Val (adenine37-N6)-methyltransferase
MAHPGENTFAGSCPDTATAMKPRDTSETTDTILGGALPIAQPANGYRFSMDSILLARFADVRPRDRVLELGAGCGVISILIAAARHPKEIVALERQPHLAELIARNAALNHCANLAVTTADLCRRTIPGLVAGSFDAVIANPPYRALHAGRASPIGARRAARAEHSAALADFIRAASRYCKEGGRVSFVFTAARMPELIADLRRHHLEPKRLRMVHPMADRPATTILIEARKRGGIEMLIEPPLIIFDVPGVYSTEARRLLLDPP